MGIERTAGPGHQRFMNEMHGLLDRYETQGIPPIEQIALLAQIIGRKTSGLSPIIYDSASVMQAVVLNIIEGNQGAAGPALTVKGEPQ